MRRLWLPTTSFWISFYCSDSNKVRSVQSKVVLDLFWERLYSFTLNFTFERRKPDNRGQWWVVNCHDSWVWVSEADCEVCITGQLLAPWVDDTSNQHRPAFGCSKRNTPMLELRTPLAQRYWSVTNKASRPWHWPAKGLQLHHASQRNICWSPTKQPVDESQADSLASASPLFFFFFFFLSVEPTMLWYEKTIAQKASCHGFTHRDVRLVLMMQTSVRGE